MRDRRALAGSQNRFGAQDAPLDRGAARTRRRPVSDIRVWDRTAVQRRRSHMIKVDIVNEVSKVADITKVKAELAVDAVFDAMRRRCSAGTGSSCADSASSR